MQLFVSGSIGVAVLAKEGGYVLLSVANKSVQKLEENDIWRVFHDASDIEILDARDENHARIFLDSYWTRDRAIRLLQVMLDAELEDEVKEIEPVLDKFLRRPIIRHHVLGLAFMVPNPKFEAYKRFEGCINGETTKLTLSLISRSQKRIALARRILDQLLPLDGADKARFEKAMIKTKIAPYVCLGREEAVSSLLASKALSDSQAALLKEWFKKFHTYLSHQSASSAAKKLVEYNVVSTTA